MTKMQFAFCIALFLAPHCVKSQKIPPANFGDVTIEELSTKNYPLDTSASAVILFDNAENKVHSNGTVFTLHVRIRIFTKAAIKEWGNISIVTEKYSV